MARGCGGFGHGGFISIIIIILLLLFFFEEESDTCL